MAFKKKNSCPFLPTPSICMMSYWLIQQLFIQVNFLFYLFYILMNNQICPWKADDKSFFCDFPSVVFQNKQQSISSFSSTKNTHYKRPQTSLQSDKSRGDKKTVRPSTGKQYVKTEAKRTIQQQRISQFFSVSVHESCSRNDRMPINPKNFQIDNTTKRKREKEKRQSLYTGYSSFSRCKIKKIESSNSIFSKRAADSKAFEIKQKTKAEKQVQILLSSKLASILKLNKKKMNPIRLNLLQQYKKRQKESKEDSSKVGFVYFNKSFIDKCETYA